MNKKTHLDYIKRKGRYTVEIDSAVYSNDEKIILLNYGFWFEGLIYGDIEPLNKNQERFIEISKILTVDSMYYPVFEVTVYWKELSFIQKTWFKFIKNHQSPRKPYRQKRTQEVFVKEKLIKKPVSSISKKGVNINLINEPIVRVISKLPKRNFYYPKLDLDFYLEKISGLGDSEIELIEKNFNKWKLIIEKEKIQLYDDERRLVKLLDNEFGPSEPHDSTFYYFFKQVKIINERGKMDYSEDKDGFYNRDLVKKQKSIISKVNLSNHKSI